MADPILGRAWPALLAPGLAIVRASDAEAGTPEPGLRIVTHIDLDYVWFTHRGSIGPINGRTNRPCLLDYRDPAVRDRAARVLWAMLQPGTPEPMTAPVFDLGSMPGMGVYWALEHPSGRLAVRFAASEVAGYGIACVAVPALAAIDLASPDRDLLALRAVVDAIIGGAR